MSDLILEIYNEEVPARMQKAAAEGFYKIADEVFSKNNLDYKKDLLKVYITPRRLVLFLEGLEEKQILPKIERIGPKVDANQKAIDGFLRSCNLKNVDELKIIESKNSKCYLYERMQEEADTLSILEESIAEILQKSVNIWPKLMRFDVGEESFKWIRPIKNLLVVFGDKTLKAKFAGLDSSNKTIINKFDEIIVETPEKYFEVLKKNKVILDQEERREIITKKIKQLADSLNAESFDDISKSKLVDEAVGLCEYPALEIATTPQEFMSLPQEILILTLKLNQKYFCLKDKKGQLLPEFIFVIDGDFKNKEKIIQDNEKLVRARLSDAKFFIEEDLQKPLEDRVEDLKNVVFHTKLGSVYDKVIRLESLAKFIAVFVPHCNLSLVEKTANLSKSDLTTKTVAELPELQGKIGSYYAKSQGVEEEVVDAIFEHYLPLGPKSKLPQTSLGITLSIADKIDSIVGYYVAGDKPTSSKDPYGLRRSVLGIIRIALENNIAFSIRISIEKALNNYPIKEVKTLINQDNKKFIENKKMMVEEIIKFFIERFKVYLKDDNSYNKEVINVVLEDYLSDLNKHRYFNIVYLNDKIKFLTDYIANEENKEILNLNKRLNNILAIEEKKDGKKYEGKISRISSKTKYEKILFLRSKQISSKFKKLVVKGEFEEAFALLDSLKLPLIKFFDNVLVNCEESNIRENRLKILSKVREIFNFVGDISKI